MQSFIIISKDIQKAKERIEIMAKERKISKFDIFSLQTEKTVGIADIRGLSKQIFLKPIQGEQKIVVLEAFFGISIDAQNAFLKVLEEPPFSTTIIIVASSNFFLPTILSRCVLIELDKEISIDKKEEEEILKIISSLEEMEVGERLKTAQNLSKDKQQALIFLEKLIIITRNEMVKKGDTSLSQKLKVLQKYYKELKQSNVNLRLSLENLFLEI
ncbi:MAG: hypothetical protein AAB532_02750 [Patescibacteria group bacterium]